MTHASPSDRRTAAGKWGDEWSFSAVQRAEKDGAGDTKGVKNLLLQAPVAASNDAKIAFAFISAIALAF